LLVVEVAVLLALVLLDTLEAVEAEVEAEVEVEVEVVVTDAMVEVEVEVPDAEVDEPAVELVSPPLIVNCSL
jgi:hypothetical protein